MKEFINFMEKKEDEVANFLLILFLPEFPIVMLLATYFKTPLVMLIFIPQFLFMLWLMGRLVCHAWKALIEPSEEEKRIKENNVDKHTGHKEDCKHRDIKI